MVKLDTRQFETASSVQEKEDFPMVMSRGVPFKT